MKGVDAELVLAQRRRAAAQAGVGSPQRAMRALLQGIEAEESVGDSNDTLQSAVPLLPLEEIDERADHELAESRTLGPEPLLEGGVAHLQALEECPAAQGHRRPERVVAALRDETTERPDVALHGREIESYELAVHREDTRGRAERAPQTVERPAIDHLHGGRPPRRRRSRAAPPASSGNASEVLRAPGTRGGPGPFEAGSAPSS